MGIGFRGLGGFGFGCLGIYEMGLGTGISKAFGKWS